MAKTEKVDVPRYLGTQLLKDKRFDNRVARLVIRGEKYYTIGDAEKLINDYLEREDKLC